MKMVIFCIYNDLMVSQEVKLEVNSALALSYGPFIYSFEHNRFMETTALSLILVNEICSPTMNSYYNVNVK